MALQKHLRLTKRNRVLLLLASCTTVPTQAAAEVCDKVRPNWTGEPVTALQEAMALGAHPISLVLLLATALAVRTRNQWGGLAIVIGWTLWISAVAFAGQDIQQMARLEGCTGSPVLFIVAVAAICIATILYTAPNNVPTNDGDT